MEGLCSYHYIVTCSGVNLKSLVDAAENYQQVLAENRKLFHEVQDLKGDIISVCPKGIDVVVLWFH